MAPPEDTYPLHSNLTAVAGKTIYQTDEWWKAVVQYTTPGERDSHTTAIYLWNADDGEWKRRQKYAIKSIDAWQTDSTVINSIFEDTLRENNSMNDPQTLPISEYYQVKDAVTIFKTDSWWKAIVHVVQKGEYDCSEVMAYVWYHGDDEWKRRQKYAIQDQDDWETEVEHIRSLLDVDAEGTDSMKETFDRTLLSDNSSVAADINDLAAELASISEAEQ